MFFTVKCIPYGHSILFALDEEQRTINRHLRQALHLDRATVEAFDQIDKWRGKRPHDVATCYDIANGPAAGAQIIRYDSKVLNGQAIALLVHEILHAASFILRRCGIEHTSETEEAYTYLVQHITQQALKRIGKEWWK